MNITIPDDYQNAVPGLDCFSKLEGHSVTVFNDSVRDVEELARRFQDADALVLIRERTEITEKLLSRLPRLKLISQTGGGTAHIDLDACKRRNITVAVGTGSPYAPAELTWTLILSAMRGVALEAERLRAGRWQTTLGTSVRGRTLGIWGYGKIGSLVAGYGRAFGMNVLPWGREGSLSRAQADGYEPASGKTELFEKADVLSLHLRLSEETRGIVTAADLALMKSTALLVNTSRAELIEPRALAAALRRGRPGFGAVDVYEEEPLTESDHPLLKMANVLCTPHLGYVEKDSYELYFAQAFDHVIAFGKQTQSA